MNSQTLPSILNSKTLLQIRTNHNSRRKVLMENFQGLVLKLAEAHPNVPLTPAGETHVRYRLNQFLTQYKIPDHPPYSVMIERALRELNEKGGCSEDSISQFLEKEYNGLPWAHSALLKHHLAKLCESGDIVVMNRGKRYMLAAAVTNPSLNLKSTSKKRKWKRKINRKRLHMIKKQVMIRTRYQQKRDKIEVTEKYPVEEQRLTEHGEQAEDNLPGIPSPERPPGFEFVRVDFCQQEQGVIIGEKESPFCRKMNKEVKSNLLIPEDQPDIEISAEELCESNRAQRLLRRWSMRLPESNPINDQQEKQQSEVSKSDHVPMKLEHLAEHQPESRQPTKYKLRSRANKLKPDTEISLEQVKAANVDDPPTYVKRRGRPPKQKPDATKTRQDLEAEAEATGGATKTSRKRKAR